MGFAQSHFEISAIFGLLLLCYGFLPVYRKLNVYTLSEYMSRRYDDKKSPPSKTDYHPLGACYEILRTTSGSAVSGGTGG